MRCCKIQGKLAVEIRLRKCAQWHSKAGDGNNSSNSAIEHSFNVMYTAELAD